MSRGRPLSPILRDAFEHQKRLRAEFTELRWNHFMAAEEATRGALLNRKGIAAGIDTLRLFTSNRAFAYCYASEELIEWWAEHPRMTFPEYEKQMYEPEPELEESYGWVEMETF